MVARNRGIRLQLCPRAAVSPSAQRTRFTSQSLPGLPLRGDSRSSGCTARRDYPWERRVLDPMDSSSVDGSLAEERTGSGSDAAPPTRTERNHDDEHRDGHGDDRTDSALSARRVHKRRRVAAGAGGCGGRLASSRATGGRTRSAEASARTKIDRRRRCTTCGRRSNNCPPCIAVEGSPTTWLVPGVAGVQLPMQRRRAASPSVLGRLRPLLLASCSEPLLSLPGTRPDLPRVALSLRAEGSPPPSPPPAPRLLLSPSFHRPLPATPLVSPFRFRSVPPLNAQLARLPRALATGRRASGREREGGATANRQGKPLARRRCGSCPSILYEFGAGATPVTASDEKGKSTRG